MTRQLLIAMQLLTTALHNFFRYNTTTADEHTIENSTNAPVVSFARLTATNLYYSSFGEQVKGFSLPLISGILEDLIVDTYYK